MKGRLPQPSYSRSAPEELAPSDCLWPPIEDGTKAAHLNTARCGLRRTEHTKAVEHIETILDSLDRSNKRGPLAGRANRGTRRGAGQPIARR